MRLWWQHPGWVCGQTGHWGGLHLFFQQMKSGLSLTHATNRALILTHMNPFPYASALCTSMYYLTYSSESPHDVDISTSPYYREENWGKEVLNNLSKIENKELCIMSLNPTTLTSSKKSKNLPSSITLIRKLYPVWYSPPLGQWGCTWWGGKENPGGKVTGHTQGHILLVFPFIWNIQESEKIYRDREQMIICQELERGRNEKWLLNGYRASFLGVMKIFWNYIGCTTLGLYQRSLMGCCIWCVFYHKRVLQKRTLTGKATQGVGTRKLWKLTHYLAKKHQPALKELRLQTKFPFNTV